MREREGERENQKNDSVVQMHETGHDTQSRKRTPSTCTTAKGARYIVTEFYKSSE